MDWRTANEQQQEALWRVFLMFIAMALLIIRTGLVSRGVLAALPSQDLPQPVDDKSSASPDDLYQATLVLLCLAEIAGRLVITMARAIWELMNNPPPRHAPQQSPNPTHLCERAAQRLDTS